MKYNNGMSSVNIYQHPLYRALKKAGADEKDAVESVHALILHSPNVLTKEDIKNFASKNDFNSLKEELKKFATKDDFRSLKEELKKFATKDDFRSLKEEIVRVEKKLDDFIKSTNQRLDKIEAKLESLSKIILGVMVTTWGFSMAAIIALFFMLL